jgi:hypothetical protein
MIEANDAKYDANRTRQQFEEWGATAVENVDDLTDQEIPKIFKLIGLVGLFLLLVPPVMIFRSYGGTNRHPRLHVVPDMDWQDKYKPQQVSPNIGTEKEPVFLYADDRAMRAPVAGTIARGDLQEDDRFFRGYEAWNDAAAGGQLPNNLLPKLSSLSVDRMLRMAACRTDPVTGRYPGEPDWVNTSRLRSKSTRRCLPADNNGLKSIARYATATTAMETAESTSEHWLSPLLDKPNGQLPSRCTTRR